MNEWKHCHPIVSFAYFLFAICFSCLFLHPITLAISLAAGFCGTISLKGKRAFGKNLAFLVPVFLLTALINPAFNHEGVTILLYLPSGNPLTAESIVYGLLSAAMLSAVLLLFSCFHEIITSDKLIYLFGKILPSLSLIFSMTLRFVPHFTEQLKQTSVSQKCIGRDVAKGNVVQRAKNALSVLSVVVTQSLENAVDTADSMKSRGYGFPGRSAFSLYHFGKRDGILLGILLFSAVYAVIGRQTGAVLFSCFPQMQTASASFYTLTVFAAYFLLLFLPFILELSEVLKWKSVKSKT